MVLPKRPHLLSVNDFKAGEPARLAQRLGTWALGVHKVLDALPAEFAQLERDMAALEGRVAALEAGGGAPAAHASTHLPSGSDPLATDAAGDATPGDSAAEGTAESLARSDHQHGLPPFGRSAGEFAEGDDLDGVDDRVTALENVSPIITQWTPDAPPTGSAHAKTDEFDTGSSWAAKWTEFDQSAELTPTVANGFGKLSVADAGTTRNVAMYQAVPAVAAYAFACKLHMAQVGNVTGSLQAGLFLSQDLDSAPTTADWEGIRLVQGSALNFATWTLTAYNAAQGALSGNLSRTDRSCYMRCRVTSTTTVAWDWSDDGIGWHELTNHTIGFTPVHMGVWVRNNGTGGVATVQVQWFRVVEATVANGDLSPGGRVLNVFA